MLTVFKQFSSCLIRQKRCVMLLVCSLFTTAYGQTAPPLDRLVAVDVRNERVSDVLKQVSQQAGFAFSYNPVSINDSRLVTLRTGRQPVRVVLTQLFTGQLVTWKVRGNHVLLLGEGESRRAPSHFFLDGYITDEQTGQRIGAASVYERTSLASTVSNPYGYYRLRLSRDLPPNARVEVRKRLYAGESVTVSSRQSRTVDIRLRALTPPVAATVNATARRDTTRPAIVQPEPLTTRVPPTPTDSTPSPLSTRPDLAVPQTDSADVTLRLSTWDQTLLSLTRAYHAVRQVIHLQNLDADTLYRPFQLSLVPYVGTNHLLSNHVINHLSINLIAGTSLGVTGLELGGVINGIRGDVHGAQFAGFANFVGRNMYGFQAAGFLNQVNESVEGGQAAGFGNTVRGDFAGLQLAGFFNKVQGKGTNMIQAAGFTNKIQGNANRIVQLAGFTNKTRDLRNSIQAAGFINHARRVTRSLQIAPINVADSSNSIPIGLLSFVRQNGYRRWEVSTNETFPVNLTFRTGVKRFYNLITAGTRPSDLAGDRVWQAGYGLGTGFGLGRTWTVTLEASSHVLWASRNERFFGDESPSLLIKGSPMLEKRAGRLALAIGPSINFYNLSVDGNALANTRLLIAETPMVGNLPYSRNGWASWIGWQIGLRWTSRG